MNKQSFLPINNHYSPIDLPTLKSNNFKTGTMKRKGVEMPLIIEISKYSNELLNKSQSKESIIINSKEIVKNSVNENKTSYYNLVDMLNIKPKKINLANILNQRYLKTFSTLDIELAQNQSILYEFNSKTLNSKILNNNVSKILEYSFFEMSSVISRPYFYVTPKNVIINLFYFVINKELSNKKFLNINLEKLEGLSTKLSKFFKKPIKLDLTQIYSISNNSQILAHILGKLGLKRKNSFTRIIGRFLKHQSKKIFFRKNQNQISRFSTILTGVNINLGGRLMRGKIVPRRTVKKIQYGSLARSKSNYVTTARLTQKNKRGSFSFTVSIGHKFF